MPSVIATHNARQLISEDEIVIVDGIQGVVIVAPDEQVLAEYKRRQRAWREARRKLSSIKKANAVTLDGAPIELVANIELPQDVEDVKAAGAVGIGLFRSEFLFLGRDTLPSEDEQFEAYRQVVADMKAFRSPSAPWTWALTKTPNGRCMASRTTRRWACAASACAWPNRSCSARSCAACYAPPPMASCAC